MAERKATAILGGGCFWCLEAVFEQLRGVAEVVSGYAGGHVPDPGYREVSTGTTGHAEVVRITYDPDVVTYRELLEVFFTIHDPTTPDRQGADVGPQYRSIILYQTPEEKATAQSVIGELEAAGVWSAPVVTQLLAAQEFYPAEDYHQGYYRRNSTQPYCRVVIDPKVARLRERFLERLKR